MVARTVAPRLSELLGQQVVIENVGGAGGMTGAEHIARAAPDGYQIVIGVTGTHAQNQSLYKKPLFNAATDFAAVGLIAEGPYILITRKDLPAADLERILDLCESEPEQDAVRIAWRGLGNSYHLSPLELSDWHRHHARALS